MLAITKIIFLVVIVVVQTQQVHHLLLLPPYTSTTSSSSTPALVYDAEALLNHLLGSISLDGVLLYEAAPQDETLTSTVIETSISAYIAEDEYYLYEEDSEGYIYNDYHYFRGDNDGFSNKIY